MFSRTIVISCAGMGNRLGLGTTKALVEVDGKPLIVRHLEKLKEEKDIRVVVGYQAEKVIEVVKKYRQDVMFVFNHDYRATGTGASVALAARYANEYILSLDGD
ncbi:MAG: NTP transferase domain-containing protein, partial [Muribaculaceae bacterium]|nr:NTP transferase domain-containing protein [Muribaculaceae bacterium]